MHSTGRQLPYTRTAIWTQGATPPSGGFHACSTREHIGAAQSAYTKPRSGTISVKDEGAWRRLHKHTSKASHANAVSPTPTPLTNSTSDCTAADGEELRYATPEARTKPCSTSKKKTRQEAQKGTSWTSRDLKAAIEAVEEGACIKTSVKFYGIPPSSLTDHLRGRCQGRKRGPPPVFTVDEEAALETYMIDMANYGHPLSTKQLRLKVALMTQERPTPFTDGIPRTGWLCWFKKRHPDLTRRQAQGLELDRAKGLCGENVASFYTNLEELYRKYQYPIDHVWNCDELDAQAGRSGGG